MRKRKFNPTEHKKRLEQEKKDLNNRWNEILFQADKYNIDQNLVGNLMEKLNCLDKRLINENLTELL